MINKMVHKLPVHSRWKLAIKILPIVAGVVVAKLLAHAFGWEFLGLSSLFTAIISANIFLIGFLVSGTLVDYKESEKLPGELAGSLETMADEALIIFKNKKSHEAKAFIAKLIHFNKMLLDWLHQKERTRNMYEKLRSFNDDFLAFEGLTQANFIARLKQEQHAMRKMLTRIHTIRETDFVGSAYAIVEIITFVLVFGLVFVKIEPLYESLFFASFVSFMLIYMIHFIKDLDNPFGHADETNLVEDVSLKPIEDSLVRLEKYHQDMQ